MLLVLLLAMEEPLSLVQLPFEQALLAMLVLAMFGDVEAGDVGAFTVGAVAWPIEQSLLLVLLLAMEEPLLLVRLTFEQSLLAM